MVQNTEKGCKRSSAENQGLWGDTGSKEQINTGVACDKLSMSFNGDGNFNDELERYLKAMMLSSAPYFM